MFFFSRDFLLLEVQTVFCSLILVVFAEFRSFFETDNLHVRIRICSGLEYKTDTNDRRAKSHITGDIVARGKRDVCVCNGNFNLGFYSALFHLYL